MTRDLKVGREFTEIRLEQQSIALDELHVIGYGSESKRFSVGSTATLSASEIEKQPVTNVLLALEGQIPGLNITSTSGVPGSQVKVQIRGQNTLNSNPNSPFAPFDQPLFIIDGVPFAPQNQNIGLVGDLTGTLNGSGGLSPFNSLNPNDIESISILKDADATSIYGTQGSNGVVLITTKKGKPGKTNLNVTINSGNNYVARPITMLNTSQYIALREEAFKNDGLTPSENANDAGYAPDLTIFNQTKNTDFL